MISALDAKKRAQNSNESVQRFLEILGKEIEIQADAGKYEYVYSGGKSYDPVNVSDLIGAQYARIPEPPFWKLVKAALEAHPNNFRVQIFKSEPFIPTGLGSSGDEEPIINMRMKISWA